MITSIQHPFRGREHGDARWGDVKSFTKDYGNHDDKNVVTVKFGNCKHPAKPVTVNTHNYWLADGIYVNIDNKLTSNLNILVVGPPGTGKSFRLARPLLSQLAGNFLVTDPKGELLRGPHEASLRFVGERRRSGALGARTRFLRGSDDSVACGDARAILRE